MRDPDRPTCSPFLEASAAPISPRRTPLDIRIRHHRRMLLIACGVIVAACLLQVRPDQRVELRGLPGWPLPELCLTRSVGDVACPGCGLTRSFIYLRQGRLTESLQLHPVGWLLALAVLIQIPYRLWMLRELNRDGLPEPDRGIWPTVFSATLILALVTNFVVSTALSFW